MGMVNVSVSERVQQSASCFMECCPDWGFDQHLVFVSSFNRCGAVTLSRHVTITAPTLLLLDLCNGGSTSSLITLG